jgi:NTE family protein
MTAMHTFTHRSVAARQARSCKRLPQLLVTLTTAIGLALVAGCGSNEPRQLTEEAMPHMPERLHKPQPHSGVALVLSSGGLRGLAHVGVLRALHRQGLRPDLIVGSSVGAFVGAAYASGLTDDALSEWALPGTLDPFGSWLVTPTQRGLAYEAFAAQVLGGRRIEQFPSRFIAVATERRNGCIVLFGRGDAARAVAASSALPGAMAPVSIRGQTFSDGGLAAPLPVRVARGLGARYVIAVDTTFHAEPEVPAGVIDSVFHAGMVMSRNLAMPDRAAADVLIEPQLPPVAEVTLANQAALVAAGERAALASMPQIKALFARAAASALDERRADVPGAGSDSDLPYCAADTSRLTAAHANRRPSP